MEIEKRVVSGSYGFSEIVIFLVDISLNVFFIMIFLRIKF